MSLLIKGMGMPKLYENEEHLWVPGWLEIGKDCTAVFCTGTHFDPNTIRSYAIEEVPTHGRLIDADRLIAVLKSAIPHEQRTSTVLCMIKNIENAPTVIEKEANQ